MHYLVSFYVSLYLRFAVFSGPKLHYTRFPSFPFLRFRNSKQLCTHAHPDTHNAHPHTRTHPHPHVRVCAHRDSLHMHTTNTTHTCGARAHTQGHAPRLAHTRLDERAAWVGKEAGRGAVATPSSTEAWLHIQLALPSDVMKSSPFVGLKKNQIRHVKWFL